MYVCTYCVLCCKKITEEKKHKKKKTYRLEAIQTRNIMKILHIISIVFAITLLQFTTQEILENDIHRIPINSEILSNPSANVKGRQEIESRQLNTFVFLDGSTCNYEECIVGNFITDALLYHFAVTVESTVPNQWCNIAGAVVHGGFITNSIDEQKNNGDFTREDLNAMLKSPNEEFIVVKIKGSMLRSMFERSFQEHDPQRNQNDRKSQGGPFFLQVSKTMRIIVRLDKAKGLRVVRFLILCTVCENDDPFAYQDVEDGKEYPIALPSSLYTGLGYQDILPDAKTATHKVVIGEALYTYALAQSPIFLEVDMRLWLHNGIPEYCIKLHSGSQTEATCPPCVNAQLLSKTSSSAQLKWSMPLGYVVHIIIYLRFYTNIFIV